MNKTLNIIQANRLYLATMILVVSLGTYLQSLSFSWGFLATEILLILLPTLWMLKHNQIDVQESMGLHKTRASLLLVAAMLGGGAWLVTSLLEQIMVQITGYLPPSPVGIIPSNALQAILIFLGLVVLAPISEEILFRGSIQPAYQNQSTEKVAILATSLMFALYHLRLQGLPALMVIAFLLGYAYWRTRSLTVTIILHAANNFMAAILLIRNGMFPTFELPFPNLPASAFGIMMIIVGLVLLQRLIPNPINGDKLVKPLFKFSNWNVIWPLLISFILFVAFSFQEISSVKQPVALPLQGKNVPVSALWTYEIQHKGDEIIGSAECQWHESLENTNLSCQQEFEGFEYQSGNSYFSSLTGKSNLDVTWKTDGLDLVSLDRQNTYEDFSNSWHIEVLDSNLLLIIQSEAVSENNLVFTPETLVEDEWTWRLMGLPFSNGQTYLVEFLTPLTWRNETNDNGPLLKELRLVVTGPEEISVPAGDFQAWKVGLENGQTAWYSMESPHILVRFDASMFNYLLTSAE